MSLTGNHETLGLSCDTAPIAWPVYPRGQVVHNLMSKCPKTDSPNNPSGGSQAQAPFSVTSPFKTTQLCRSCIENGQGDGQHALSQEDDPANQLVAP